MTTKLEKGEGIKWITVQSNIVGDWYRTVKHLKKDSKIRYEDATQNYLLNHLHMLRSEKYQSFWVEDKLRDSVKEELKKKYRADVIVEYADQIWLIEVKGHNAALTNVFENEKYNAVKQLRYYEKRLKKLGWWGIDKSPKKLQKVVFWCHSEKNSRNKRVPIDLSETSKWPKER